MSARFAIAACFVATVIGANWALGRYGIVHIGPLEAPAGVYFAGAAFGLRDALHELERGRRWALAAIAAGALVSYLIEDAITIPGGLAPIAVASAAAFALSELADLAVYDRIRQATWIGAVALSNTVGAVVDSALFLWLAFGGLDHLTGQVAGKLLMVLPALLLVRSVRQRKAAVA